MGIDWVYPPSKELLVGDKQLGNHPITTDLPSRKSNISHLGSSENHLQNGQKSGDMLVPRRVITPHLFSNVSGFWRMFGTVSCLASLEASCPIDLWPVLDLGSSDDLMVGSADPEIGAVFFFGGDILISNFFFRIFPSPPVFFGWEVLSNILRCCCFFLFFLVIYLFIEKKHIH